MGLSFMFAKSVGISMTYVYYVYVNGGRFVKKRSICCG